MFFVQQKEFLEAVIRRGREQNVFQVTDDEEAALFVLCVLKGAFFYNLVEIPSLASTEPLTRSPGERPAKGG